MKKRPIDHISTLEKEEQLELEMMNIVFGNKKQKNKIKDGTHVLKDSETGATIIKEYFKDGKREGLFEFFWDSGQVCMTSTGEFVKDKPMGLHKHFHENGTIHQEIFYKDGKPHGKVFSYLDTGELDWMNEYLNGEEV